MNSDCFHGWSLAKHSSAHSRGGLGDGGDELPRVCRQRVVAHHVMEGVERRKREVARLLTELPEKGDKR